MKTIFFQVCFASCRKYLWFMYVIKTCKHFKLVNILSAFNVSIGNSIVKCSECFITQNFQFSLPVNGRQFKSQYIVSNLEIVLAQSQLSRTGKESEILVHIDMRKK